MKKLLVTSMIVLTSFQSSAFAGDFPCRSVYEKKVARLDKTQGIRTIGRVVLAGVAGGAVLSLAFFSGGTLTPYGAIFFGTLFGGVYSGGLGAEFAPREDGIRASYEAQTLLEIDYAALEAEIYAQREEAIRVAIAEFDSAISHPQYLARVVKEMNEARLRQNLPYASAEEVIAIVREQIRQSILNGSWIVENSISDSLDRAKRKGWVPSETTYDQFRLVLRENQEKFCPKNRALKMNSVVKSIFKP